ncbi:hypothetical protein HHI36_012381 [Cryptolaemus montrouzieri]|uniref:Uncharacterized protein n=1 Tax=Cryptolaemus montrouzieri TaxID=559131 RepID=A0ABD2NEJ3_9CUCU
MDLILFLKCASLNFGFSLPMLVGLVGHFYKSVEGQLISAAIYDLSYIIIALMASSGASIGFLRGNKVMELFENLNIHTYRTPEKFNVIKLKIEKITTFVYYYCITISVSMMFMSHILDSDCYKRKNKGQASGYVCGQIIPAWFPIEIDYFPWKHLLWLINFIEAAYIIPKMNVFFVSYYGCVILIINRIEHLKKMLKSIDVHGKDISLIKQEFKKCFIYYSEIHRLTDDFNSTIGFAISTSQNALLGSLIAVMEYQVVMVIKKIRNIFICKPM